jgi:large subunit ribosomal protein L23
MKMMNPRLLDEAYLSTVLLQPIVSEKSTFASDKKNEIFFVVLRAATKPEIKAAVELMFKVEVDSVSTLVRKGKVKRTGKVTGRRNHLKRAHVTLKKGQAIDFSGGAV